MGKSVRELTESMDYDELAHWVAFQKLHGFPDSRAEHLSAQLAYIAVSLMGKGKHKLEDFSLDEIIPEPEDPLKKLLNSMVAHGKQNPSTTDS